MKDKLKQIMYYIDNYDKINSQDQLIDYYKVFELDQTKSANVLFQEIKTKKLKILFHPDLTAYIPDNYKQQFEILSNFVKDMENVFSSNKNKENYDQSIKKQQSNKNEKIFVTDAEIQEFNDIISTNILKHGFDFTYKACLNLTKQDNFKGITNTNNCRTRATNLGRDKIITILNAFSKENKAVSSMDANIIGYLSFLLYQNKELMKKIDSYINACKITTYKYGVKHLNWAINEELRKGTLNNGSQDSKLYQCFTNNQMARENLREKVPHPKDLLLLSQIYLSIHKNQNYQNVDISKLPPEIIIQDFANSIGEELGIKKTTGPSR